MKRKLGQITIRKIGKKYIVSISGSPEFIFSDKKKANSKADFLRKEHGRRLRKKRVKGKIYK